MTTTRSTVTIRVGEAPRIMPTQPADGEMEWLAAQIAAGRRCEFSMQLNAGPILRGGRPTGRYGVWHHDGQAALKLDSEYPYAAARELCRLAGLDLRRLNDCGADNCQLEDDLEVETALNHGLRVCGACRSFGGLSHGVRK